MSKFNPLFTVSKLIQDDGKDVSLEASFLQDLDFTLRQMNKSEPHYYFREVTKEKNPEFFETVGNVFNCVLLSVLPDKCDKTYCYEENHLLYHTNDQKYYIGCYYDGKPSRRYKPSSMQCMRSMYYQLTGADLDKQQQKTGDFYGICESGTDRHLRIQSAISNMKKYGIDCEYVDVEEFIKERHIEHLVVESKKDYETKLYDPIRNIIFLCDGILKYKGEYLILECKTESSRKWMDRQYVDDSHRNQAYTYSLELGLDKVLFLYENRDICTKKTYILEVTQENRDFIEKRIKDCDFYVSTKSVPPIEESVTKKVCQYCDYRTLCKLDNCL